MCMNSNKDFPKFGKGKGRRLVSVHTNHEHCQLSTRRCHGAKSACLSSKLKLTAKGGVAQTVPAAVPMGLQWPESTASKRKESEGCLYHTIIHCQTMHVLTLQIKHVRTAAIIKYTLCSSATVYSASRRSLNEKRIQTCLDV